MQVGEERTRAATVSNGSAMRILFVVDSFYPGKGGAESQARLLSRTLRQWGHDVTVIAPLLEADKACRDCVDGVPVIRIRYPRWRLLGAVVLCAKFARFLLANRRRYDAIHVHIAKNLAAVAGLMRPFLNATLTVKVSGAWEFQGGILDPERRDQFPYSMYNRFVRRADHIQCVSEYTRSQVLAAGYRPDRVLAVANAVDLDRFARASTVQGEVRVVFVGRHVPVKGLEVLLEAWRLSGLHRFARLVLAGDGPQRETLMAHARALGVSDSVDFPGWVLDVPGLLASACLYAQASYQEGLSNAVLEAMASGLPVVATRISGHVDLIDDGRNGILVEPGNAEEMARSLEMLIQDPIRAREIGQEAYATVQSKFGLSAVLSQLVSAYRTSVP